MRRRALSGIRWLLLFHAIRCCSFAAAAETGVQPLADTSSMVGSVVRLFGALGVVFALFMGFIWLWKRWQRLGGQGTVHRKLEILESRSLGNRQSLCVIGYEGRRLLLALSPSGVTLLTSLPDGTEDREPKPGAGTNLDSFSEILCTRLNLSGGR